ncbi:uncharacterized protein LOC135715094 [Ochlerotatus camptorhynchus]|uniref:uncharacterized protein LOC135715094 n=1 Tax=Ochlerotatus camptorhynchus TaxID=644619 RepID=UPI0031DBC632
MSFFTSFQELLDFDQSTNLNGFHFSNSLFGFDSNSIPALENLPPPAVQVDQPAVIANTRLKSPSPIPEPTPLLETPKQCHTIQPLQQQQQQSPVQPPTQQTNNQQVSPIPIVSKFQLKVTLNNEIYISNESGTFCELAGSFVPSTVERKPLAVPIVEIIPPASPDVIEPEPDEPKPPKTLFCIERGIKRPLSPSDQRYCNSGIFRSLEAHSSPLKKKSTSTASNGLCTGGPEQESVAKLVVSNVINNGLIVNKKHLSNNEEQPKASTSATPERRIMRTKKKKRKAAPKTTLEAKVEPVNGKITTRIATGPTITSRKVPQQQIVGKRPSQVQENLRKVPIKPLATATATAASASSPTTTTMESTLNFSGIKEKAAQEAIFIERVEKQPSLQMQPPQQQQPQSQKQQQQQQPQQKIVQTKCVPAGEPDTKLAPVGAAIPDETSSSPAPVELKVVADLVMDKEVFGHISLLSNGHDRSKAVIYQNPVTTKNVIYSILNPKSLNLSLGGCGRGTTATLTLEPHRRKPKKRGRKKKVPGENPTTAPEANANGLNSLTPIPPDLSAIDPDIPVMITRSGRLSKPPRYANNFFQNIKQKPDQPTLLPPPPPPPPVIPRIDLPATDPETIEKLPNFSAALTSTVAPAASHPEPEPKRKMNIPLQYRCATCNKIYLGKRMQRHLEKYPSHNSQRDCMDKGKEKIEKEDEKSTYLYKHLFDLLQKFTEKDKGRVMLKEISNFVDYVRALIPKLITNDEQNSTVEYIDHNVADVLRLNHGKYRLKLSSLAEEYDKLNLTVNLLNNNSTHGLSTPSRPPPPLSTSTPNGTTERHSLSFNADDILNQSSSFPSLTTLMHEHNLLLQQNGTVAASNNIINNNNNSFHQQNNNHQHQQSNHHHHHPHLPNHHHHHHHYSNHHHHLPLIGSSCHDDAMNSLSGLCKSPVQHSTSGMVNMALNLY